MDSRLIAFAAICCSFSVGFVDAVERDFFRREQLSSNTVGVRSGHAKSKQLQEGLHAVDQAVRELVARWPGKDSESMLKAATEKIPPTDQGQALRAQLRRRQRDGSAFVFAALGSSVTAGHDNYGNQSWPYQLQELLKPVFKKAGFDFEVRQRAFGGFGEMPFTAGCLADRVGHGVDALNWEWSMFYDNKCEVKHFLHEVTAMDSQPVLFTIEDASLRFDASKCANDHLQVTRGRISKLSHNEVTEFEGGTRRYRPNDWYFSEDFVSSSEVAQWRADGSTSTAADQSSAAAAAAANDFQTTFISQTVGKEVLAGVPVYPVVVSAGSKFVWGDPWYETREKAFNINWHPGPLGHQLLAAQMSYYMLQQLRSVLQEESSGGDLGAPERVLVKPCGLVTKRCTSGVEPQSGELLSALRVSTSTDSWVFDLSTNERLEHTPMMQTQVDLRRVYRGTPRDGELLLTLENTGSEAMHAMVCAAPCGWNCHPGTGYVASNTQMWWDPKKQNGERANVSDLTFTVDGQHVPDLVELHDEMFGEKGLYCPSTERGCKSKDVCQPVGKIHPGSHQLGVKVVPRSQADPEMFVEILQVMLIGEPSTL